MSENGATLARVPRMKERYHQDIVPALMKEFGYENVMQVPRFTKISVNIGLGEALVTFRERLITCEAAACCVG
jgi:ribosomal protein L5